MATNRASGQGKKANPSGLAKSPKPPKESNKSNNNKAKSPKSRKYWLGFAGIVAIVGFVAAVIAFALATPSAMQGRNNFTVETHDGETYYVMHGSYNGEYGVQYINLKEEFSDD